MLRTVSRSFPSLDTARRVVADLEGSGFRSDQLSLIGCPVADGDMPGGGANATGLLGDLGMISVPGLGPLVSGGWLASTLVFGSAGTLAGSIVGALAAQLVSPEEANGYAGLVQRGYSLVLVSGENGDIERAMEIMDCSEPIDPEYSSDFENRNWSGSAA
jgi:hypothetical protein